MAFMFNEHTPKKILFNGHNVSKLIFNGNLVFGGESGITVNCFDVETELLLQTINLETPADGILYFNNDNAPIVDGYDFVVMDGAKHIGVVDGDSFNVWYVSQSVPDRTKTSWVNYFRNNTNVTNVLVNTYSATTLNTMFYGCTSLTEIAPMNTSKVNTMQGTFFRCSNLTTIPQMDTSNVTNVADMLYQCSSLTYLPYMDTSKVQNFYDLFNGCTSLQSIDWEIDMRSCTYCAYMLHNCAVANVKLKNVPSTLDLSLIGRKDYTVINYI